VSVGASRMVRSCLEFDEHPDKHSQEVRVIVPGLAGENGQREERRACTLIGPLRGQGVRTKKSAISELVKIIKKYLVTLQANREHALQIVTGMYTESDERF
jgi:hypothetical protein